MLSLIKHKAGVPYGYIDIVGIRSAWNYINTEFS
jgi:hypothetical protein